MNLLVGRVTHYFGRIGVAVLELTGSLRLGDTILILGHTTDLTQHVESMEIEHRKIQVAEPGMDVALQVAEPVRNGDEVYKVVED
jgi:translation elongation factor EF-1alpha